MKQASDSFPRNTLRQAELAMKGWKDLMDKLNVPNLSMEDFEKKIKVATEKVDLAEPTRTRSKRIEDF